MRTPELAQFVRQLRLDRGLSLDELARLAVVARDELEAFEVRGQPLSTSQLRRVAAALEVGFEGLLSGELVEEPQPALFFRQYGPADLHEGDRDNLRTALREAELLAAVEGILGHDAAVLRGEIRAARPGAKPWSDGYFAARQLRGLLKSPTEVISDVLALIEDTLAIPVRSARLQTVSAVAVTVKDMRTGTAVVVLNEHRLAELNGYTYRVTLAHELAHVLLDVSERPINLMVDREIEGEGPEEQRARAFAAELLVPLAGLREILGNPGGVFALDQALGCVELVRRQYWTPAELTVNHLMNLGYIERDQDFRVYLIAQASARRDVPVPHVRFPGASGLRLAGRVRRAYDEHRVSANRARELLDLSSWDPLPWDR